MHDGFETWTTVGPWSLILKKIGFLFLSVFLCGVAEARTPWGSGFNEADLNLGKNSLVLHEKEADPATPLTDEMSIYIKDLSGTTTIYTKDAAGSVTALLSDVAISDAVYGAGWNGDTTHAPSKNAVYDKIETISAGSGDVTSVGDCTDGACYDGSSDGGTYTRLYDGDSHYTAIVSSNVSANTTITLPATTGTLLLTNGAGTSLTALDGENIQDDTIDDDSIDFADVTGADITLTDAGAITSTGTITATVGFDMVGAVDMDMGSADVTDFTVFTDGTGDSEVVLPDDSIGDAEIDWSGLTTSADFTVTGTLITSVGIDAVGAVDLDYGSADVTDHTFIADGGTVIIDGSVTIPTGSNLIVGVNTLTASDKLDGEQIGDDTIDDDSIDFADVTLADITFDVGSVDTTEFGYLNGVTSAIQTQLDAKANDTGDTFTGAVTINNNDAAGSTLLTIGDSNDPDSVAIFGDLTVTGGDITLGTSLIFSGGDITSLNLIDALDSTTVTTFETSMEANIDTLSSLTTATSLGTVSTALTGVLRADSGVLSADTDVTDLVSAASTSASGKVEIAIASEVDTGTDTGRAISPDALAGSNLGEKIVQMVVFDFTTNVATGDGKFYFVTPSSLNGMDLVECHARVITAGTTNSTTVQIHNLTQTADMLSALLEVETGETGSDTSDPGPTIDAANDDVATYDVIRVDVDTISTTAPKGLIITLIFRLP